MVGLSGGPFNGRTIRSFLPKGHVCPWGMKIRPYAMVAILASNNRISDPTWSLCNDGNGDEKRRVNIGKEGNRKAFYIHHA